jgi:hypothetical protein
MAKASAQFCHVGTVKVVGSQIRKRCQARNDDRRLERAGRARMHFGEELFALVMETQRLAPWAARRGCMPDPRRVGSRMEQFLVN